MCRHQSRRQRRWLRADRGAGTEENPVPHWLPGSSPRCPSCHTAAGEGGGRTAQGDTRGKRQGAGAACPLAALPARPGPSVPRQRGGTRTPVSERGALPLRGPTPQSRQREGQERGRPRRARPAVSRRHWRERGVSGGSASAERARRPRVAGRRCPRAHRALG